MNKKTEKNLIEKILTENGYTDLSYRITDLDEIQAVQEYYNRPESGFESVLDDGRSVEIYSTPDETLAYVYPIEDASVIETAEDNDDIDIDTESDKLERYIFKLGDRVICEVHRGQVQDDDGISTGGEWVTKFGTVEWVNHLDCTVGGVKFDDGDYQCLSLIENSTGYPGRNIRSEKKEIDSMIRVGTGENSNS